MQSLSKTFDWKNLAKRHSKALKNIFVFLIVIAVGLLGFWFSLRIILGTEYPLFPVSSSNMCLRQPDCNGFTHSFEPTLHIGDLIMIQGVDARNISVAYPNSDILVFYYPKQDSTQNDGLAITRVIAAEEKNGTMYFRTKSDGTGTHRWPEMPEVSECDSWHDPRANYTLDGMISEKLLVGKVIFRIPWFGYFALLMSNPLGILVVIAFIVIIVLTLKFCIPKFTKKKVVTEQNKTEKMDSDA